VLGVGAFGVDNTLGKAAKLSQRVPKSLRMANLRLEHSAVIQSQNVVHKLAVAEGVSCSHPSPSVVGLRPVM